MLIQSSHTPNQHQTAPAPLVDADGQPLRSLNAPCGRRDVLKMAGGLAAAGFLSCGLIKPVSAMSTDGAHRVYFRNAHTGESFNGVYRVGNKYLPEAFDQISHILRDFRNNEQFPIDPRTIDILYVVQRSLDTNEPFQILSGYRSPRTNAMLSRVSYGVARHSLHMTGQAIDVRMTGKTARNIRDCAKKLQAGGVGFYPKSNFVHLDSGVFRTW